MKFDCYILNSYVPEVDGDGPALYAKWIEQVELAEELGFHCAWFTEHHFSPFGGMLPSPQLLTAALAHRTSRIRFGSSVSLLSLHSPLRIAEDVAVLDVLTGGRIEVGIGRGMAQTNYAAFGTDPASAQQRFDEALEVLMAAFGQEELCWSGRFFEWTKPVTTLPRPVQKPHPPIWQPVSNNPAHVRGIGQRGFNLMTIPWHAEFSQTQGFIAGWREGLRDAGHDEASREILGMYYTHVAETPRQAEAETEGPWRAHEHISAVDRGQPGRTGRDYAATVAGTRAIFGDTDMCRRHIERIQAELGLTRIACAFHFGGMPQDRVLASMRLFAREVAPAFG